MQTFSNRTDSGKKYGKPGLAIRSLVAWMESIWIKSINMPDELIRVESLVPKCPDDKIGRTQESVGHLIFFLLAKQNVLLIRMFMPSWQIHSETPAFLIDYGVCKARMSIGSLENSGDSQSPRHGERSECSQRPSVNDIDLPGHFCNSTSHYVVVQRASAHSAEQLVRNPQLAQRQCLVHFCNFRQRFVQDAWENENVRSRSYETVYLLPGGVADSLRTELVGKAV